jgi:hypothetical protein
MFVAAKVHIQSQTTRIKQLASVIGCDLANATKRQSEAIGELFDLRPG